MRTRYLSEVMAMHPHSRWRAHYTAAHTQCLCKRRHFPFELTCIVTYLRAPYWDCCFHDILEDLLSDSFVHVYFLCFFLVIPDSLYLLITIEKCETGGKYAQIISERRLTCANVGSRKCWYSYFPRSCHPKEVFPPRPLLHGPREAHISMHAFINGRHIYTVDH